MRHPPLKLVIAGLTAVTVLSVTSHVLPDGRSGDPGGGQASSGYVEAQKQDDAARRATRNTVQDALNSDELASREARSAAKDAVRSLLRDP